MSKLFKVLKWAAGILVVLVIIAVVASKNGSNPSTAGSSASGAGQPASTQASAPAQPAYDFSAQYEGKTYKGKTASNVGVAVVKVSTTKTVGNNPFAQQKAPPGSQYVLVTVAVHNGQKDQITMDASLFKILADGKEYSPSSEAQFAIQAGGQESLFLKGINPGVTGVGTIAFEVPDTLKLDGAQLQFRGGMLGDTATVPLQPITQ